jgi:hypothetical protein
VICAEFDNAGYLVVSQFQPVDMAGCPVLLVTGQERDALMGFSFPSPADFSTAWAWGFSLVVGSYLIGWAAGAVLRFFNRS